MKLLRELPLNADERDLARQAYERARRVEEREPADVTSRVLRFAVGSGAAGLALVAGVFVCQWLATQRVEFLLRLGACVALVAASAALLLAYVRVDSVEFVPPPRGKKPRRPGAEARVRSARESGPGRGVEAETNVPPLAGGRATSLPNRLECGGMGRCRDGLHRGDAA